MKLHKQRRGYSITVIWTLEWYINTDININIIFICTEWREYSVGCIYCESTYVKDDAE